MAPKKRTAAAVAVETQAEVQIINPKQRKTAKPTKEKAVQEKRCTASGFAVRYRSRPSAKDSDRIDRALSRGMGVCSLLPNASVLPAASNLLPTCPLDEDGVDWCATLFEFLALAVHLRTCCRLPGSMYNPGE